MATKKTTTFDPSKTYRITVSEVIKDIPGLTIRPRSGATVSGEVAEQIKDRIVEYQEV